MLNQVLVYVIRLFEKDISRWICENLEYTNASTLLLITYMHGKQYKKADNILTLSRFVDLKQDDLEDYCMYVSSITNIDVMTKELNDSLL